MVLPLKNKNASLIIIVFLLITISASFVSAQWVRPQAISVFGVNESPWTNSSTQILVKPTFPNTVNVGASGSYIGGAVNPTVNNSGTVGSSVLYWASGFFTTLNVQSITTQIFSVIQDFTLGGTFTASGYPDCILQTDSSGEVFCGNTTALSDNDTILFGNVSDLAAGINEANRSGGWVVGNGQLYNSTPSSRVGIGTSNPTSSLHVVGDANVTGTVTTSRVDSVTINVSGSILPFFNNTGSIGEVNNRFNQIFTEKLNVTELGGYSPILLSADIIGLPGTSINATFLIGDGSNITGIIFNQSTGTSIFPNVTVLGSMIIDNNLTVSGNSSLTSPLFILQGSENCVLFTDSTGLVVCINESAWAFNDTVLFGNVSDLKTQIDGIVINVSTDNDFVLGNGVLYNKTNGTRLGLGTDSPIGLFEISTAVTVLQNVTVTSGSENLIGLWRFEAGSGSTAFDSSGNNFNGSITGATYQNSKGGNDTGNFSLLFDGFNDKVEVPNVDILNITDEMSVMAWVFLNSSKQHDVVYKLNSESAASEGYELFISGGEDLIFLVRRSGSYTRLKTDGTNKIPLQQWTHVAATLNGSNITLYINGEQQPVQSSSRTLNSGSTNLFIGINNNNGADLDGGVDEVSIFNKTLNTSEVFEVFEEGSLSIGNISNVTVEMNVTTGGSRFVVGENGHITVYGKNNLSVFEGNVQIKGTLFGGSPVKVAGGFKVLDGDIIIGDGGLQVMDGSVEAFSGVNVNDGNLNVKSNASIENTIVAQDVVDLTRAYDKNQSEALKDIGNVRSKFDVYGNKVIDHNSLPKFAQVVVEHDGETKQGRSIGGMVSVITDAVKELKRLLSVQNSRVSVLESENKLLKSELCIKDLTYSWCKR